MTTAQQLQQLNQQLILLVTLCSPIFVMVALALAQFSSDSLVIFPFLTDDHLLPWVVAVGVAMTIFEAVCIVRNLRKRALLLAQLRAEQQS